MLNNGNPVEVRFRDAFDVHKGLRTTGLYLQDTWRMSSRFTVNLGLRFDRYRSFLPDQEGPSGGRFSAATATQYDAVNNVKTFNHPVPRVGIIYDVTGEGRTVVKANYAQYFWNPGTDIANVMNPNSQDYYKRYNWTDGSNLPAGTAGRLNGIFDVGETIGLPTTILAASARRCSIRTSRTPAPTKCRRGSNTNSSPASACRAAMSIARSTTSASASTSTGRSAPTTCRSRCATRVRTRSSATATTAPTSRRSI
jgi:hypothetical protein